MKGVISKERKKETYTLSITSILYPRGGKWPDPMEMLVITAGRTFWQTTL